MAAKKSPKLKAKESKYPIKYWSYSSLMMFLRNPLAWHKRYVEKVYDLPSTPTAIVGRAAHTALEHFYQDVPIARSIERGLAYLKSVADFEIDFGKAKSKAAIRKKRKSMEQDYLQAISYYLAQAPKHKVIAVEYSGIAKVPGIPVPIKAISDLVVESRVEKGAVDIVDHKFVAAFSPDKEFKTLFLLQALFNYFTVTQGFNRPVRRFIVYECKRTKNKSGKPQLRRYIIDFKKREAEFPVFFRLMKDATQEVARRRLYLPNPTDMFDGENSFDIYRLGLGGEKEEYSNNLETL